MQKLGLDKNDSYVSVYGYFIIAIIWRNSFILKIKYYILETCVFLVERIILFNLNRILIKLVWIKLWECIFFIISQKLFKNFKEIFTLTKICPYQMVQTIPIKQRQFKFQITVIFFYICNVIIILSQIK